MKQFMLLHYGFEKPTQEIMQAWQQWFGAVADKTADNGGFHGGARELTRDGARDLHMDADAITGYTIINAETLEEAEAIAKANPFITAIRVYEIVRHQGG